MVHGFDQVQVEKKEFFIVFHNINSKYKLVNRERQKIIFKKNFLSPSWRLGPKISLVRKITLAEWPREASHELINLIPRAEKLMRNC